jgi:hypothetical protein
VTQRGPSGGICKMVIFSHEEGDEHGMGVATWYFCSSQEQRQRREPVAAEVFVLPYKVH